MVVGSYSESDKKRFQDYVQAILREEDMDLVLQGLNELRVEKPYYVRMKVLYSGESPTAVFARLATRNLVESIGGSTFAFLYKCQVGRSRIADYRIPFVILPFSSEDLPDNVQVLVTVCTAAEWKAVLRLIKREYPLLVPILLSQQEMIDSVRKLGAMTRHAVQVKSYSARERIGSPQTRKWKVKREWTDEDLEEVIELVQERNEVLKSLDVVFYPRRGEATHIVPSAVCKVRKTGEVEVDGSFEIAFSSVASVIAEAGLRKLRFFSDRGLRRAEYKPRPVAITYAKPVFEDLQHVRDLVALLAKYPHSMHAIQHGNPYAHLKLVDMLDHSSFDIWAIPPCRVAILPGMRASEAAFERVVDYMFEGFREGDIVDYRYAG